MDFFPIQAPHPKELADETLHNLMNFCDVLSYQSAQISELEPAAGFYPRFIELLEGIQTFTDALANVKSILRVQSFFVVDGLEAQLVQLLRQLVGYQESQKFQELQQVLKTQLPEHFCKWKKEGLPLLARSRDT